MVKSVEFVVNWIDAFGDIVDVHHCDDKASAISLMNRQEFPSGEDKACFVERVVSTWPDQVDKSNGKNMRRKETLVSFVGDDNAMRAGGWM